MSAIVWTSMGRGRERVASRRGVRIAALVPLRVAGGRRWYPIYERSVVAGPPGPWSNLSAGERAIVAHLESLAQEVVS